MKKPLHVIIEGGDCTGKTPLCEMLSNRLKIHVISMQSQLSKYGNVDIERVSRVFNYNLVLFRHFSFILDRGYPSSWVYSKIYGRTEDLSYLDEIERELNPQVFVLICSDLEMLKKRKDEIIPEDDYEKLQKEYIALAKQKGYLVYDIAQQRLETIAKEIHLWLNTLEMQHG